MPTSITFLLGNIGQKSLGILSSSNNIWLLQRKAGFILNFAV